MVNPILRPFLWGIARIHFCYRTSLHSFAAQANGVMQQNVFHNTKSMLLFKRWVQTYLESQRAEHCS
ncbi:hypothetical protein DY252_10925 [Thalassospira indica]|uniref:Secreted protein n=1 Tax=Thalassospira indica TaxID=1891279 RepID=A0ABN5NE11_9PROT|nr:hypothetical protein DY252_10925 [Thalassospira indica]